MNSLPPFPPALHLNDPCNEYFMANKFEPYAPTGLLHSIEARRWFKTIHWGSINNLYTYQQRFESKHGTTSTLNNKQFIMMSSYDYLGLIGHSAIEHASCNAIKEFGTATGGVRLLTGSTVLHHALEDAIAKFKGCDASLTFSSGYSANIAALTALTTKKDVVLLDELSHRSIRDAGTLCAATIKTFLHNDLTDLENKIIAAQKQFHHIIIGVEGIYSMDGDRCPLPQIVSLKKKYGAFLMVDEAHSFGVLGKYGRGIDEYYDISPTEIDIWVGTLSKTIPSTGGFIAGSKELILYLQHAAAPFIFSAALSPASAGASLQALKIIRNETWRHDHLFSNARYFSSLLHHEFPEVPHNANHIIPFITKNDEKAYRLSKMLFDNGIIASAIVFPAVAKGKARLRLCVSATHTKEALEYVAKKLIENFRCL